jgi:hypothetical protein
MAYTGHRDYKMAMQEGGRKMPLQVVIRRCIQQFRCDAVLEICPYKEK